MELACIRDMMRLVALNDDAVTERDMDIEFQCTAYEIRRWTPAT